MDLRPIDSNLKGIGGWLLLFCVITAIVTPLNYIVTPLNSSHPVEQEMQWSANRIITGAIIGLSAAVGILVWTRSLRAILLLRIYFIVLAAVGLLGVLSALATLRLSQTGTTDVILPVLFGNLRLIIFVLIWGAYFHSSERVRANLGRNLF